nr:DNA-binding protein [Salmonella sp. NCTC 7297]
MGKLGGEMKALAKKAGGSFKTVDDRIHIVQRFSRHLRSLNIQIQAGRADQGSPYRMLHSGASGAGDR